MSSRKFRLLILDDELDIVNIVKDVLKTKSDIETFTAVNVQQALDLLPQVDGVIADCILPGIQSFDQMVRRTGKPIIRMSGKVDRATNLEIPKPFTRQQILDSVELLRFFHSPLKSKSKAA